MPGKDLKLSISYYGRASRPSLQYSTVTVRRRSPFHSLVVRSHRESVLFVPLDTFELRVPHTFGVLF